MSKHEDKETLMDIVKYLLKNKFKEVIILLSLLFLIFVIGFRTNIKVKFSWLEFEIINLDSKITEVRR